MARAATTSDVFNAIAESQRRDILALLRAGERPVTDLAQELGMSQPGASNSRPRCPTRPGRPTSPTTGSPTRPAPTSRP
ncbi:ArsR family transcriptional regulator [Streptomyces yerevanensis]|uniref:ArsR family transcriptional regulator n=1 Tax=Streptomyces yerevanensis TaxID=66378 RepID=UPI001FE1F767|nr:ArsR family transcriptional regulator [Streptomyces yerevanensis]